MKRKLLQKILVCLILVNIYSCSIDKKVKSDAYGNFEATEVTVSSEANGRIISFNAKEGDTLKKNQVVCEIDAVSSGLKKEELFAQKNFTVAKLNTYNSQIEIIEAQKKIQEKEFARFERMFRESAATQKQLDDIAGQINVLEKQIENVKVQKTAAESELKLLDNKIRQINDQIMKCSVINPISGTIINKFMEQGELAVQGKALYKIADLESMYLRVYVSEPQLSTIKIGQSAEILIDGEKNQFLKMQGTVTYISDKAEFTPKIIQTRDERVKLVYAVKISVKNNGAAKIGMPAEVNFK